MADIFDTQDNCERAVKEETEKKEDQAEYNLGLRSCTERKCEKKNANFARSYKIYEV